MISLESRREERVYLAESGRQVAGAVQEAVDSVGDASVSTQDAAVAEPSVEAFEDLAPTLPGVNEVVEVS